MVLRRAARAETVMAGGNTPHREFREIDLASVSKPGDTIRVETRSGSTWWLTRTGQSHSTSRDIIGVSVHTTSRNYGTPPRDPAEMCIDRMVYMDQAMRVRSTTSHTGGTSNVTSVYVNGERVFG